MHMLLFQMTINRVNIVVDVFAFTMKWWCVVFCLIGGKLADAMQVRLSKNHDVTLFVAVTGGLPFIMQLNKVMHLPSSV